jgi:5'-3' exonuclease
MRATVDQIRSIASGFDYVAICLDSPGKNWRHEMAPSYKANREALDELSKEQLRRSEAQLRADGFAMLAAPGFEADDVIATVCAYDFGPDAPEIRIVSGDKDLMQLASSRCRILSVFTGSEYGPDEVKAKWGITPAQMGDYLALVGDTSDNVPGVKGVGPKRAAELLQKFGDLHGIVGADAKHFTPAIRKAIGEASDSGQLSLSRELVSLRTDAPVDVMAAFAPRTKQPTEEPFDMNSYDDADNDRERPEDAAQATPPPPISAPTQSGPTVAKATAPAPQRQAEPARAELPYADAPQANPPATAAPKSEAAPAWHSLVNWDTRYEPKTRGELWKTCEAVIDSSLFSGFGRPSQVMLVLMAGAELGLGTMASLRSFHIVENRPCMSAQAMMALCLGRKASCKLFMVASDECSDTKAVVYVQRPEWDKPQRYEWTYEMAKGIMQGREGIKKNWKNHPRQMLINRCIAEAARFTWPEILANVYTEDEIRDAADAA